ncbi:MAG TPA: LacI family DNA-binding transcriptional regulator [Ramlibacter sp.]|nr:LacI family DNA-binding transcriptional regulator [Ramlibacter sp.]
MKTFSRGHATVIDVARRAGVSLATVSRVLNNTAAVSDDKRHSVVAAMDALGYRPNPLAQGLRKGQSNTVALLVGDIAQRHFAELTQHVQGTLEESGHDLLLFNLGHRQRRLEDFLARAPSLKLRGIVLTLSDAVPRSVFQGVPQLREAGITLASIGQDLTRHGFASIAHEERAATRRSVQYLIGRGRRRIAYIGRIKGSAIGTERYRGWRDAVQEAGLYDPALVWDRAFRYAAGHAGVLEALHAGLRFDAIQAGSDEIAAGAMAALHDRRVTVPGDVAVIGFGDIELGAYLRPGLTTLSSDAQGAARHLGEWLRTEASADADAPFFTLPRTLVERGSA